MPLPSIEAIRSLPDPTPEQPLRVLLSGCLAGFLCGTDATSYGEWSLRRVLAAAPNVALVPFCPEDFAFGTPREVCNIHGGDGFDVLDGKARVLTESGKDWTEEMIGAAHRMLAVAREHAVHLAILMDISAACGSQVIYDGHRTIADKKYQVGAGVCAALLIRNGFLVASQRDARFLEHLLARIDPRHTIDPAAIDHHETPWYREYFATGQKSD